MNHRLTPIAATMFAAVAAPLAMQPAFAQTAGNAALPEITVKGSSDNSYKVEESASSKFTKPLLDTPKTVSVITSEVINQSGSTTLVEALRTTPGISFGAGEGGNAYGDRPFIRGFDAGNSTFIDGMRDLGSQSREIFNVESVEVIKGASSAFGGGGSTGGAINIISKAPKKEQFTAGSVAIGTDNYKRVTADGNYLLGDNAAIRLNAMYHDQNVAGRDAVSNNRWGFAPAITFGLNSPTRVTLSYYHMQSDEMPDSGIPYNNPTLGRGDGSPVNVNRNNFYGLTNRDFRKTQADILTARVEHDISSTLHLKNTTRYSKTSNDYLVTQPDDSKGNIYNGLVYRRANTRKSDTTGIQNQTELFGEFTTGSLKHHFSVGLEFSQEKGTSDTYQVQNGLATTCSAAFIANYNCTSLYNPNPGDPWKGYIGLTNRPKDAKNDTYSVYAFDTIDLNSQWSINGGIRYDNYRATSKQAAYAAIPAGSSPTGATIAAVAATNFENKSSFFNYQAGIVFKPVENGSIYVSYSTSSDPAGLSANEGTADAANGGGNISLGNQNLAPERSKSYELGTKWDLLNKDLSLTAAIFRTEKTNGRVTMADGTTQLAGNYKVDGVELGIAGKLTSKWSVFGGYTYMKSKIVSNGNVATSAAYVGNQFANIPTQSASLWTTYDVLPKLTIGGGMYYMGKVFGNVANTKWVPSYTRIDAMASYVIDKNMTLQLNLQNLNDKVYYNQAYTAHYASIAPGRSAILALNVKY